MAEIINLILMGLLGTVILLLIFDITNINKSTELCLGNPLVYGVSQWEKQNNAEFLCSCYFPDSPSFKVYVTSENLTVYQEG